MALSYSGHRTNTRHMRSETMDPVMIQMHLAQAERHADEGRRLMSRQEGLIANLKKRGHDTADADKVRDILIETQSILCRTHSGCATQ